MWTPNQLLRDEVLKTLREAGFSELKLEFLGWLSYNASAINRSRNPVKAAHTILAGDKAPKMFAAFQKKKQESVRPKERPQHDAIDEDFRKLEAWAKGVESEEESYFDS
jgi:hypothetical protein